MEIRNAGVVVTGASRGLGAALARALAREGAKVVGVARGAEALRAVVDGIRASGGQAWALPADVADKGATYPIAGAAAELAGPIELVIHAASELGPTPLRPLFDTECEDLEHVLAANLIGPFRLTKLLAAPMLLRGRGAIVNVTSDASIAAYPAWGAYGVSKAALDHLGRIWGAETEGTGVRFVSIDPGEMDTRMHADAMPDADRTTLARPEAVAERFLAILRVIEALPNGARVEAARFGAPASVATDGRAS